MRITMDISSIVYNRGVSFYTTNLVRNIKKVISAADTLSLFGASFGNYNALKVFSREIGVVSKLYPVPPSLATLAFHATPCPIDLFINEADIFHTWEWYLPSARTSKVVITLHDVALFKFPKLSHPAIEKQHREVMERIKKLKPTIIAVSESTKLDLIEVCNLPADSIHVVYEAIPMEHQVVIDEEQLSGVKEKYALKRPYMLMVGTAEPRKNFSRQIEAWQKFKNDFDLVIVGAEGWEHVPTDSHIIRITQASAFELAALYKGASVLLYCSLYEGFGLPILEAFYHELPVVTANTSAMSEIGNSAVVQCDPHDVQSIKQGIQVAIDNSLILSEKSKKRLHEFSWQKAAKETYVVYEKALQI